MAIFEPGHLHIERHALNKDDVSYDLCLDYEVVTDDREAKACSSPCMAASRARA